MRQEHVRDLKPLGEGVPVYSPMAWKMKDEKDEPNTSAPCVVALMLGVIAGLTLGLIIGVIL